MNALGIEKKKRVAKHLNRLAHLVHFYHHDTDEHHEEGSTDKKRSLTELLAALQNYMILTVSMLTTFTITI